VLCRVSRFIYYYAECRYAECRYAECHYAECRGPVSNTQAYKGSELIPAVKKIYDTGPIAYKLY
jgi:hypothetical protein